MYDERKLRFQVTQLSPSVVIFHQMLDLIKATELIQSFDWATSKNF